jgi:hypothetical protein
VLLKLRHPPLHEFVEERHSKGGLSVALTPEHAFFDQLLAYGGDRSRFNAKFRGASPPSGCEPTRATIRIGERLAARRSIAHIDPVLNKVR